MPYNAAMVLFAVITAVASIQGTQLPKLSLPTGTGVRPDAPQQRSRKARLMTAAEVKQVVSASRTVKAVLPWATFSARRNYIEEKGHLESYWVRSTSGVGDYIMMAGEKPSGDAAVVLNVRRSGPGKMYVVVVSGDAVGQGVLGYETASGSGELPVNGNGFRFPIGLATSSEYTYIKFKVKTAPTVLTIDAFQVFEVD